MAWDQKKKNNFKLFSIMKCTTFYCVEQKAFNNYKMSHRLCAFISYCICLFCGYLFADNTVSYLVECGRKLVAPMNCVWYPVCQKTFSNFHDNLLIILYQAIPSMIMDMFTKSKFKLTPIVRKMMMFSDVIKFFIHNEFVFANENLFDVINR